jgi:hypothetical protein
MKPRKPGVSEDAILIIIVFVVWSALALLYTLVPMFDMPGSARVWGAGAALFLALAAAIIVAERKGSLRRSADPQ